MGATRRPLSIRRLALWNGCGTPASATEAPLPMERQSLAAWVVRANLFARVLRFLTTRALLRLPMAPMWHLLARGHLATAAEPTSLPFPQTQ